MTLPPRPHLPHHPRLHHRRLRLPDILRPLDLVAEDGLLPLQPLPPSRPSPQAPSPLSRFSGRETPMDRWQASWSTLTRRQPTPGWSLDVDEVLPGGRFLWPDSLGASYGTARFIDVGQTLITTVGPQQGQQSQLVAVDAEADPFDGKRRSPARCRVRPQRSMQPYLVSSGTLVEQLESFPSRSTRGRFVRVSTPIRPPWSRFPTERSSLSAVASPGW